MSKAAAEKKHKPSQKAKALSARLCAVQALYQATHTNDSIDKIYQQFIEDAPDREIDGEKLVEPDGALLKKVLFGVQERKSDIIQVVESNLKPQTDGAKPKMDILLQSILLCAGYELLVHQDIDSPIIINDYLNVTHAFYEKGEVSLVNGVLDAAARAFRD
ncbi:MAG: transcription antitermination protein NusB [Alphaproteobacteria bacterium]|nr:transcription antitermination protein NusB [Alphaproteobacteria bacterium]